MVRGFEKVHALCGEYPCSLLILRNIVRSIQANVVAISKAVRLELQNMKVHARIHRGECITALPTAET